MKKEQLKKLKKLLEIERNTIVKTDRVVREDFSVCTDDRFDEIDQAATDSTQSMFMRLGNRRTLYLKKLEQALARIEEGTFGMCEACEEDIGVNRLLARPTTTLCVECKEHQERQEILTASGREHKSLGESFSRKYA